MKITLVILTKNEIDGVRAVVPKIPRDAIDEIIAVDGASLDGTKEYLRSQNIRVIEQTKMGRGEAFFEAVRNSSGDAIIFFSPDGNEDAADIPKFRSLLEQGADIVIASRMMKGARNEEDGHWFRLRKWVNLAFGLGANILWNRSGTYVTDTINGFRAIRRDTWNALKLDGPGYTIEYQMSIRAFKQRRKILEFPTHEFARIGVGGAPALPTGVAFIRLFLREMRESLGL